MISLQSFAGLVKRYLGSCGRKDPGVVVFCPLCGRRMNQHGHYPRGVCRGRRCQIIPIYRRCCRLCKVTISLLPDFVKPHGRVENGCRELVIRLQMNGRVHVAEISRRFSVSERTVYRWIRQARKVAAAVVPGMLIEAAGVLAANPGTDQLEAVAVPATDPGADQEVQVRDRDTNLKTMLRVANLLCHSTCTPGCRYSLHLAGISYVNLKFCPASARDCA